MKGMVRQYLGWALRKAVALVQTGIRTWKDLEAECSRQAREDKGAKGNEFSVGKAYWRQCDLFIWEDEW